VTPGANDADTDCRNLCLQFNARRSQQCMAQADERNARARLDNLIAQRETALRVWVAASVLAVTMSLIPFIGSLVAVAFVAAATIALVVFLGLAGAVNGASADWLAKAAITRAVLELLTQARQLLLTRCPAEAGACLASPSAC